MSEKEVSRIFANNLRGLMSIHNINQKELAQKLGASESSVSNWLNGINVPRTGVLQKLTEIFDCRVSDLLISKEKSPSSEEAGPSAEAREAAMLFDSAPEWLRQQVLGLLRAAESNRAARDDDPKGT